ncbi:MAG TPA: pantetheine-phosphate adenylyltransferase [Gammaproteobacteria bacterium]|jgi:pantetheine-phosphate adenylyltransferase|nr:pantetheine-phosphate adenylyltransferase [Gammaproteobacteria bacterium]
MKNIAVYAGTFDPITYGHIDVIERATRIFDQVIVAIGSNTNKNPLFSIAERTALTTEALAHCGTAVNVQAFTGLLIDFVKQQNATVILRGLRAVADFDYEFQLASMNRFLNTSVESVFLMPAEKYTYISSSLVREIASLGGDVTGFVPKGVVYALERKFSR